LVREAVRGVPQFERKGVHFSRLRGLEIRPLSGIILERPDKGLDWDTDIGRDMVSVQYID
jgi:hypothetical protein